MTTPPVGVERRIGQRFAFNLPVSLFDAATGAEGLGFTQNVSSRGVFLFTDMPQVVEGAEIQLTLQMPSEITLGESMRVRCRGRVLRVLKTADGWKPAELENKSADTKSSEANPGETSPDEISPGETKPGETKIGVAVCLKDYEYLSEIEDTSANFRRISALHTASQPPGPISPTPSHPHAATH